MADIQQEEDFLRAIGEQQAAVFRRLDTDLTGSDELSALIKCAVNRLLFNRLDISFNLSKWIVCSNWSNGKLVELHTQLIPYSTSMDAILPNENIDMLVRQHRVPGSEITRWSAKQEGSRFAFLANDRILACRLNALHAMLDRKPGAYAGQFSVDNKALFEPLPPEELAAFEGEEIDDPVG